MIFPRVVIIEDELLIRMYMKKQILQAGATVLSESGDSREVSMILDKNDPDLVFLDVRINGPENGIQLADTILKNYRASVVFVSAYQLNSDEIPESPRMLGAYQKPLSISSIQEIFDKWREHSAPA